jgi:hypothetical protein
MRLYPKQLNSLEDLKREKKSLTRSLKSSEAESLISMDDFIPKNDGGKLNIPQGILSLLGSKSLLGSVFSIAPLILQLIPGKTKKKVIGFLGKDVLGGWLKWKLLRFAVSSLKDFIPKKNKDKKPKDC